VVVAVSLTLGLVLCDLGLAFPLKFILDKYVNHQDPSFPLSDHVLGWFNHFGSTAGLRADERYTMVGVIIYSASLLLALGLVEAVLSYAQLFLASFIGQRLAAHLRTRLFDHLQRLSLEWHSRQHTGDLVQRLTGNIADIEKLVTDGLVDLLAGILTLAGMLTVMLLLNWQFTLLTIVIVPALFAAVFGYTRSIKVATKLAAKDTADVADIATEDLGAITEIKAFTLEERESRHFRRFSRRLFESKFAAGTLQAEFTPLVMVLMALSNTAVLAVGAYVMVGHSVSLGVLTIPAYSMTAGTLTLFIAYLKQLYQPMRDLSKLTNIASSAGSAAERIQAALDQAPEVDEHADVERRPERARGGIVYRGVVFGYAEGVPVLKRIDLNIAPDRRVALVGLSGSGKTTMVKLIPRFYDVWEGAVELDGTDVRRYPLAALRANISLVLQDSILFEGTIRDNLALGRPDATDADVVEAARRAHIHDRIMAMSGGYGAEVRGQGKNFSGGERQRLAIARAMLRDSPVLILDEPTANLDVEAEAEVMRAIDTLIEGRTVVMISHRLSTLGHADEIIVLADGEIAEQGTFSELERSDGIFARMLAEQYKYTPVRAGASVREPVPGGDETPPAETGLEAARSMSRWFGTLDADGEPDAGAGPVVDLRKARRSARESNSRIRRES
jgi:ABC-type multidrug transport system fused ATPase/permease subunit